MADITLSKKSGFTRVLNGADDVRGDRGAVVVEGNKVFIRVWIGAGKLKSGTMGVWDLNAGSEASLFQATVDEPSTDATAHLSAGLCPIDADAGVTSQAAGEGYVQVWGPATAETHDVGTLAVGAKLTYGNNGKLVASADPADVVGFMIDAAGGTGAQQSYVMLTMGLTGRAGADLAGA